MVKLLEMHEWLSRSFPAGELTIEPRPPYCDRGAYLAKVHISKPLECHVDDQDGWPRYYFDMMAAMAECEAWLRKRGQWVAEEPWKLCSHVLEEPEEAEDRVQDGSGAPEPTRVTTWPTRDECQEKGD